MRYSTQTCSPDPDRGRFLIGRKILLFAIQLKNASVLAGSSFCIDCHLLLMGGGLPVAPATGTSPAPFHYLWPGSNHSALLQCHVRTITPGGQRKDLRHRRGIQHLHQPLHG